MYSSVYRCLSTSISIYLHVCECVNVCARVCARVHARVRAEERGLVELGAKFSCTLLYMCFELVREPLI